MTVVTGLVSLVKSDGSKEHRFETSPILFGPVLDVTPFVRADNEHIDLEVKATVTTFLGYDKPPAEIDRIRLEQEKTPVSATLPLPRIQKRQASRVTTLRDGQTLVLGSERGGSKVHEKNLLEKRLLVFVTATIIDPAGNRIHPDN